MPRRRLTLKDRLAELDVKIARADSLGSRLRARRAALLAEAQRHAQEVLAMVDTHTLPGNVTTPMSPEMGVRKF